jgi:hypothetical protein
MRKLQQLFPIIVTLLTAVFIFACSDDSSTEPTQISTTDIAFQSSYQPETREVFHGIPTGSNEAIVQYKASNFVCQSEANFAGHQTGIAAENRGLVKIMRLENTDGNLVIHNFPNASTFSWATHPVESVARNVTTALFHSYKQGIHGVELVERDGRLYVRVPVNGFLSISM